MPQPSLTYPPLNTLKPVAKDVWIVDGPVVWFGAWWFKIPFPTRMTVIRLAGEDIWIHSPTALPPDLRTDVELLGRVRWVIAPNRLHHTWLAAWRTTFPSARFFLAPKVCEQAGAKVDFDFEILDRAGGYPWDADIETLPIASSYMTEVEFFHRATRTLVLTDLIENFEMDKIASPLVRLLIRIGGVHDPHGSMPRDMRMTFLRKKEELTAALRTMIDWNPERIIIAHGRWYERNGRAELIRAFRWLLERDGSRNLVPGERSRR